MTAARASSTDLEPVIGVAKQVLGDNKYLVLGTASAGGSPWVSPVYFAQAPWLEQDPPDLWWVSLPQTRHSRLIRANSQVAVTVFDSSVGIGEASAVYIEAWAQECDPVQAAIGAPIFSARSIRDGARSWALDMVTGSAAHRLYRARIAGLYVLAAEDHDERVKVWPIEPPHAA